MEQLVVLDGDHIFDIFVHEAVLDEAIIWGLAWLMMTL